MRFTKTLFLLCTFIAFSFSVYKPYKLVVSYSNNDDLPIIKCENCITINQFEGSGGFVIPNQNKNIYSNIRGAEKKNTDIISNYLEEPENKNNNIVAENNMNQEIIDIINQRQNIIMAENDIINLNNDSDTKQENQILVSANTLNNK